MTESSLVPYDGGMSFQRSLIQEMHAVQTELAGLEREDREAEEAWLSGRERRRDRMAHLRRKRGGIETLIDLETQDVPASVVVALPAREEPKPLALPAPAVSKGQMALRADIPDPPAPPRLRGLQRYTTVEVAPGVFCTPDVANRWTKERVALFMRDWPTERSSMDILDEAQKMPGDHIPGLALLTTFCNQKLGLRRMNLLKVKPGPVEKVLGPVVAIAPNVQPETKAALVEVAKQANATVETQTADVLPFEAPRVDTSPKPQQPVREQSAHPPAPIAPIARPAFSMIAPAPPQRPVPRPQPVAAPNLGPPRLAQALTLPPATLGSTDPIEADFDTIKAMANLWGIPFRGEVDIPALNSAALRRDARPFRLIASAPAQKKRKCLRCRRPFVSEGAQNQMCNPCAGRR